MSDRQSTRRRSADAQTRIRRVVNAICFEAQEATNDYARWVAGYEAERVLHALLDEALRLTDALNDEADLDWLIRDARAVAESLRASGLAAKLERVEGRTAAEAQAFIDKAAELRTRRGSV